MRIVSRLLEAKLEENIGKNKVLLVMGTRRVGKTFLLKAIEKKLDRQIIKLNGEDLDAQETLQNLREANYRRIIGDANLVFIDEAQAIPAGARRFSERRQARWAERARLLPA